MGWPGNPCLIDQRVTCATVDPLVATLFAIECRNYGSAAVLVLSHYEESLIAPPNFFWEIERSVNLRIAPGQFLEQADLIVEVDRSIEVLRSMRFRALPSRIRDKTSLMIELEQSDRNGQRLTDDQIRTYDILIREGV